MSFGVITCEQYEQMRLAGEEHVLIDVREQDEWDAGHIEGAVHIPLAQLGDRIGEVVPDTHARIVVNCARGGRSAKGCEVLTGMGYDNVQNLDGGYMGYCALVSAS